MHPRKMLIPGAAPTQTTGAQAAARSLIAPYEARFTNESSGPAAHATLSRVAHDPGLLAAVRSGSNARIRSYVDSRFRPVWYHWHVSRLRITRANTTVTETGVPFVVDGPTTTLRDTRGHAIAQLQISIQDVIGYVRLNERHGNVNTVVRGRGPADVRTSLGTALKVKLPSSGTVTIAGHRYHVGSFHETGWRGQPLEIWILK